MKEKCYMVEIPSKHEHTLLEDIGKVCFIKTKTRAKISEPLNSKYDNVIMFLITVYIYFINLYSIFFKKDICFF